MEFCHTHFPEAEIWLSEFGWDSGVTHKSRFAARLEYTDESGEIKNAGINVGVNTREVQASWIIREYLILAAAGIDRAMQFMLNNSGNTDENDTGKWFETSGFIDDVVSSGSTVRKPSWYYVSTMHHWLKDTTFKEIISHGGDTVPTVYRFESDDGKNAYALWLATSFGISSKIDYTLSIGNAERVIAVELTDKEECGIKTELEIIGDAVTVTVTEKPIFVI